MEKLVASGGVVDTDGRIWYPSEGALKGAILSKDNFNVPRGELTDSDWDYMRDWLRPVLLSFIKCNKVLLEGATFKIHPVGAYIRYHVKILQLIKLLFLILGTHKTEMLLIWNHVIKH